MVIAPYTLVIVLSSDTLGVLLICTAWLRPALLIQGNKYLLINLIAANPASHIAVQR